MSAARPQTYDRIAAVATNYAATGEHAKTPLMIGVGSGRTSLQGKTTHGSRRQGHSR